MSYLNRTHFPSPPIKYHVFFARNIFSASFCITFLCKISQNNTLKIAKIFSQDILLYNVLFSTRNRVVKVKNENHQQHYSASKTRKPLILLGFLPFIQPKEKEKLCLKFKGKLFLKFGHFFRWPLFGLFKVKKHL